MPRNDDVSRALIQFFMEVGNVDAEHAVELTAGFDSACILFNHHPEWFKWVASQRTDGSKEEWTDIFVKLIPDPSAKD